MLTFNMSVHIHAPKEKVWEKMSDFGEVEKWTRSVNKSYIVSPKKEGEGMERVCEIPRYGSIREKITWWEPDKGLTYEAKNPITKFARNTWTIKGNGEDSVLSIRPEFEVKYGFLGRLMELWILKPQLKKQLPEVLAEFKYYVENGFPVSPEDKHKLDLTKVF